MTFDTTEQTHLSLPTVGGFDRRGVLARVENAVDRLEELWQQLDAGEGYAPAALDYPLPPGFKLSVVIPVYNERHTILAVLARVNLLPIDKEIIVVDDCSTDGTQGWLQTIEKAPGLKVLFKRRNEGKGAALRSGFAAATGDVVIVQDADQEYDPRDIPGLIRPIVEGQADVVFGSRYLGSRQHDRSYCHRLLNRALTGASNFFTGLRLTDMETCYKAFRRELLQQLELRQNRFGFEPEVTAKLARLRCRVVEAPIGYAARGYSQGKKIGFRDLVNAVYCIVRYGLFRG